jgi:hypothetical protein
MIVEISLSADESSSLPNEGYAKKLGLINRNQTISIASQSDCLNSRCALTLVVSLALHVLGGALVRRRVGFRR